MYNTPRQQSIILSKGTVLDVAYPALGSDFPAGATTSIVFYDSYGNTILEAAGTAATKELQFLHTDTDALDQVPNGAQHEIFVTTADGPYKYQYGSVIRRESTFFDTVPSGDQSDARIFTDTLGRSAVGRKWVVTRGGIAMVDVNGDGSRYAMGPDTGLLFSQAGMRYFRPMGGDSWEFQFGLYSTGSFAGIGGYGKMRLHCGCDSQLNIGMSFEIETSSSSSNNRVHTGIVTSPTDIDYTGTPVADTPADGDIWTVRYSDITKHLQAWKGTSPIGTPVIEWVDSGNELPHGPGFRYWGFSWDSSLLATGSLLTTVEAMDYV